ncbi:MAG: hypothetical protein LBN27_12715 [Prevotellaceae bacterium]|jgi:uncharacterized protein (TIGR02145 family)|nr:hypothetical protein [Prevotellaceae bacterium]
MGLISLLVGGAMDANKAIKQNKAKNDDTTQKVVVQNRYSIDVPSFLSPTNKLGEDASLQYWSITLDIIFKVIDEPKSEFVSYLEELKKVKPDFGKDKSLLDNMAMLKLSRIFDINKVKFDGYTETKINGMNAVLLNTLEKRTFLKDAQYGSFAFIEGKDTLYQIIIQSGGTSILKLADKLEQAIYSFVEIGKTDEQPLPVPDLFTPQEETTEEQETETIHCPKCQTINDKGTNFCVECGTKISVQNEINETVIDEEIEEEANEENTEETVEQPEESTIEAVVIPELEEDNSEQHTEDTIEQSETSFPDNANGAVVTNQAESDNRRFIVLDNGTVVDNQSKDGNSFNELLQKNIDLDEKLKELSDENAKLNEQITQCKSVSDADNAKIIGLNTEIESLNSQIETLKSTQTDNEKKEEQIKNLQKYNNELKTKITALEKPTTDKRKIAAWIFFVIVLITCVILGVMLYEQDEQIINLQKDNRDLKAILDKRNEQIENLQKDNDKLNAEIEAHKNSALKRKREEEIDKLKHSPTYDKGIVINGTKWATRNVDTPGKFVENPANVGKYYQWNSTKAWSENIEGKIEDWDNEWGNNAQIWETTNNVCPAGWRIPKIEEIKSLLASENKMVTLPVKGWIFGNGDNTIFLPAAGWRINQTGAKQSEYNGYYWSATSSDKNAYSLQFDNKADWKISERRGGRTIRCVKE